MIVASAASAAGSSAQRHGPLDEAAAFLQALGEAGLKGDATDEEYAPDDVLLGDLKAFRSSRGRTVAYATAGVGSSGVPVLVMYGHGSSRRFIRVRLLHRLACRLGLWLIAVNRPGKAGTSPPLNYTGSASVADGSGGGDSGGGGGGSSSSSSSSSAADPGGGAGAGSAAIGGGTDVDAASAGASSASSSSSSSSAAAAAANASWARTHMDTTCDDIVAVLDKLGVGRVHLMFMSVGTSFAMGFATRYPSRCTGKMLGLSSWVSPGPGRSVSSAVRVGGALPTWLMAPVVAAATVTPTSSMKGQRMIYAHWTGVEKGAFRGAYRGVPKNFVDPSPEIGGEAEDARVALTDYDDLGIDLSLAALTEDAASGGGGGGSGSRAGRAGRAAAATPSSLSSSPSLLSGALARRGRQRAVEVVLLHGSKDALVPVPSAEWLAGEFPSGTAALEVLPEATHNGVLMLFHPQVNRQVQALFAPNRDLLTNSTDKVAVPL